MAKPIIKWAGGKRQLLPVLRGMMPEHFGRYFEPFFGSGALFFDIEPQRATIADSNRGLINLYIRLRKNAGNLAKLLSEYQDAYNSLPSKKEKSEYYYHLRSEFNRRMHYKRLCTRDAALFIFLNKSCYNGLYRVNSKGLFNTPSAGRQTLSLFSLEDLKECRKVLKNAEILCGDFEQVCENAVAGDFIYFDSPYFNTFDTYQAGGFSENDHRRLAELFRRLTDRGVFCLLSNSDTGFIRNLYDGFDISVVEARRLINSDAANRVGNELVIKNY